MSDNSTVIIETQDVSKYFPGVIALNSVSITLYSGRVHCILGENGAGKSTLVKLMTGVYSPDTGDICIQGQNVRYSNTLFNDIAYVPQEIDLFPNISVAENLFIPFEKTGEGNFFYSHNTICKKAVPILDTFHIRVSPKQLVQDISVSNQQLLQIARAFLTKKFKALIMDEPTSSLTEKETSILFKIINELKQSGKAIIFISHKLDELFAVGDEVTLLRNGHKVAYSSMKKVNRNWLIRNMSGEDIDITKKYYPTLSTEKTVLKAENVSGEGFQDITFTIKEGEVLGVAGLVGAGRSELFQAIFGYQKLHSGHVEYLYKNMQRLTTHASINAGMVYLPEERKSQGIFPMLSVLDNIGINFFDRTAKAALISRNLEKKYAQSVVDQYHIKTPDLNKRIMFLSGGNQQKMIIGRSVRENTKLIIFDEPTKGIDVKAKFEIYKFIQYLAEEKRMAIVLISSELDEIMRCSNRIITLYNGSKTGEFQENEASREEILAAMIGFSENMENICGV